MSLHIGAAQGEIAKTVLITGDPLRARYIAEQMLSDVLCYSEIRGMLGFTGWYKGKRVSVQGTGIGIPSTALYLHELIHEYGIEKIIRVGTCGALQPYLKLHQLILAAAAYTDSGTQHLFPGNMDMPVKADDAMVVNAKEISRLHGISIIEGSVFSTDVFYGEDAHRWDQWIIRGVLAIEMETSILYNMAIKNKLQALSILSVSDNIITGAATSAGDREYAGSDIMQLAMELA
ncbi:MAG: purine-nucleoside phosphorylase [Saprospiraceae bacterium]|nr:purine-nucleoside phosphorylase [Saprospiraceae bacterium]